jgi:hypothetical protein
MNYSGVAQKKPESGGFAGCLAWGTGHCPVRHLAAHFETVRCATWQHTLSLATIFDSVPN